MNIKLDNANRPRITMNNAVYIESVYIWEKVNGPVPKDCVIHHIDHNPKNNDINNLQLMTRKEHVIHHKTLPINWTKLYNEEHILNKLSMIEISEKYFVSYSTVVRHFRKIRGKKITRWSK